MLEPETRKELIEPEMEKEIKNQHSNILLLGKEIEKIKLNSYEYIKEHYEKIYPHIGGRVFSVLSLLPLSLIIPKYIINGREIRSHINLLWLSPSGMCKSQISSQFSKIAFNPLMTKKMSTPRLYYEFKQRSQEKISLIVEDIAVWFMDEEKIKFLEGASGEEESFSHEHMKNIKDGLNKHVDVSCFCSGTPVNITNKRLKEGILRRFSPLIITLTKEEHIDVLNYQTNGLGKKGNIEDSDVIKEFYQLLYQIQNNENDEIKPIVDYIFPNDLKLEASRFFQPLGIKLHELYLVNTATENEEFFRFIICSAFLRIFEKKKNGLIQDNHLIIDKIDLDIAKKLMLDEMNAKNYIYWTIDKLDADGLRTRNDLKKWNKKREAEGLKELPREVKFLMDSNVKK